MKIGKYDVPLFASFETQPELELLDGRATRQVFFGKDILVVRNVCRSEVELPAHSHPHEQMTYVSQGECVTSIDGCEPKRMGAGDICLLPSGCTHQMLCSAGTVIWDIFTPLREDLIESVLG